MAPRRHLEPIGQVLDRARQPGLEAVELEVFGTSNPASITRLVERFCRQHLGVGPAGARFCAASVGCVLGLGLESGDDVVLKAFQRPWTAIFLAAVQEVQRSVCAGGFPCPDPVLPPTPLGAAVDALAVVETWLPDPGMHARRSARALRLSASGLARQIELSEPVRRRAAPAAALRDHPLRRTESGLYGRPHSPLFDFEATAAGAEWIDELATRAASARDADDTPPVVGHTDWSARNVRLDEQRVLAVYDWDSVALVAESTAVGQAALTWRVTAEPGGTAYPGADEVARFVHAYEVARGRRMSDGQWRATGGAAAYTLAYTARCEHALVASGLRRPGALPATIRLAHDGERLLELAPRRDPTGLEGLR